MKRLLCAVLAVLLLLSMTACGDKPSNDVDTPNTESSQTQNKEPDNTKVEDDKNDEVKFTNSYKVPGKKIVVDVPDYQEMERGYTQLYILHGVKYVAVTADDSVTASSIKDAHDKAFAKFKENIQNYSYVNDLKVTADAEETINGIQVYKYEGTLSCALDYANRDNSYDAYVIGYSFIMDGVPCTITGSVIDQAQSQDMIDEIKATVEAMIKTLRSER